MEQSLCGLFLAVERCDPVAAASAIASGADPGAFNHEGCTPLMAAAFTGCCACVEALLPHGFANAQCHEPHAFGMTALMLAASEGHGECTRLLLAQSDAYLRDNMGQTALHLAAYSGSRACVELLLPASDASARDTQGKTALAQAVDSGRLECARALLSVSDADMADRSGFSPLSAAVLNGDLECAQLLLPASAKVTRTKALASARRRSDASMAGLIEAFETALAERAMLSECVGGDRQGEGDSSSSSGRRL